MCHLWVIILLDNWMSLVLFIYEFSYDEVEWFLKIKTTVTVSVFGLWMKQRYLRLTQLVCELLDLMLQSGHFVQNESVFFFIFVMYD